MEVMKTNQITTKNNCFIRDNNSIKPFQIPQRQNKEAQFVLPNLSPDYFHPSFGLKNPKAAMYRAKKLKEFYNSKGYPYLLPNEVWSDKKIKTTIELFGKELDKLIDSGNLKKKTLQKTINNFLPEKRRGTIIVKDFADYAKDLKKTGYSEEEITMWTNSVACTSYKPEISATILYLDCSKVFKDKFETIDFKSDAEHELQHALTMALTNMTTIDIYKSEYGKSKNQTQVFNTIFKLLGESFNKGFLLEQTQLTQKGMLRWQGVTSIEALHTKFETRFNELMEEVKANDLFDVNSKENWKQIFAYLKHGAKYEKDAYQSNKRYREFLGNPNIATDLEFKPMLYAEMEKFFSKKERVLGENKKA